jgi:hypothetical protein
LCFGGKIIKILINQRHQPSILSSSNSKDMRLSAFARKYQRKSTQSASSAFHPPFFRSGEANKKPPVFTEGFSIQ